MAIVNILHKKKVSSNILRMHLEKPAEFNYSLGQFVTIKSSEMDKPNFFAIASHPEEDELIFLVGSKNILSHAKKSVEISKPMGAGFKNGKNHDIIILTHGTGISAVRPLLISEKLYPKTFKSITIYYGIRENENPLIDDNLPGKWIFAISSERSGHYVQHLLKEENPKPDNHLVYLVGSKEMVNESKKILSKMGFKEKQIFLNY